MSETIVALSSGALPAGIAVVRISGPATRDALQRVAGPLPLTRRASLRWIRNGGGEPIDRGLVLFFEGPTTVTGEDLGELHLHGGRAVVGACLETLTSLPGIRLAQAGEFTRRAFENGRIDLTEAEGLAELLSAETRSQHRQALAQSGGSLRRLYEGWMAQLVRARALLEASFDFSDEGDVASDVADAVRPALTGLVAEMDRHLAGARRGEILRDGFRVVIAGRPNAGKSSLLNALADRDVAIVSDRPGTTRDLIDVTLDLGGLPVRLTDTAGLRESEDSLETEGIARAQAAMAQADLVLLLSDGEASPDISDVPDRRVLPVRSKRDLFPAPDGMLAISTRTGEGLDDLIAAIGTAASNAVGDPAELVPTRVRHREIVAASRSRLAAVLVDAPPDEIFAEELRTVAERLGALTGRTGVEDLLDVIFSEFCIGK
ncbi:tRNA modification GTPase TrmE [Aureimonas sp. Leaf454]|uniref:tRNA uridine-5-carboxymethylaminomethyl(34) synthesis GTPase MnmE n=1 Tax=Aureimonas sp. Leaf454 TaxID=1736381 RepID=UPI0006F8B0F5|nr:tRNA uridine-5-carboxymethylaminomethyl(34) synthesis GTPase MnmE [Aureimonas sp. Leaf454]KQT42915.1 tRNA modification GTPase TrmE [Aureimonas sp. Leaf454]